MTVSVAVSVKVESVSVCVDVAVTRESVHEVEVGAFWFPQSSPSQPCPAITGRRNSRATGQNPVRTEERMMIEESNE